MVAAGVAPAPVPMPAAAAARAAAAVAAARQRRWLQWRRQRWRTCRRCGCKRLLVAMVLGCSCWAPLCRFVSVLVRSSYFSSLLVMYTHRTLLSHATCRQGEAGRQPAVPQHPAELLLPCCAACCALPVYCLLLTRVSEVGGQDAGGPVRARVASLGRGPRRAPRGFGRDVHAGVASVVSSDLGNLY